MLLLICGTMPLGAQTKALQGKRLVTIGNSITASCGWQNYLVDSLGVVWSRDQTLSGTDGHCPMAIGGTAVRPLTEQSIFYRSFDAKYYDPDIIILYAGQNDHENFGTLEDTPYLDCAVNADVSFAAAYMGMVEALMRDNPQARIYLVTLMRVKAVVGMDPINGYAERYPHPRFSTFSEVLEWEQRTRLPKVEIVRGVARKYNLPLIDLYDESGVTNSNAELYYGTSADDCTQVHPNGAGYKRMAEVIVSALMRDDYFGSELR